MPLFESPLSHRLLLALAILSWLVVIGGLLYAHFFVSAAMGPRTVMSSQAFTGVLVIGVGFLAAAVSFTGALLVVLFSSQQSSALHLAAVVSGIYVLPSAAALTYVSYFN